jgi:hypothetical protein
MVMSTVISTLTQLINLINVRKEYKKDLLSTFVEPLYSETEKVISNYLQLYLNVIDAIRKGQNRGKVYVEFLDNLIEEKDLQPASDDEFTGFLRLEGIVRKYEAERQALYHVRAKVIELAETYSHSSLDDDIKEFASSIASIFKMTIDRHREMTESRYAVVARTLQEKDAEDRKLIEILELMVKEIRSNWERSTRQYAQIQLKFKKLM